MVNLCMLIQGPAYVRLHKERDHSLVCIPGPVSREESCSSKKGFHSMMMMCVYAHAFYNACV
jgi:hypothetical protein